MICPYLKTLPEQEQVLETLRQVRCELESSSTMYTGGLAGERVARWRECDRGGQRIKFCDLEVFNPEVFLRQFPEALEVWESTPIPTSHEAGCES